MWTSIILLYKAGKYVASRRALCLPINTNTAAAADAMPASVKCRSHILLVNQCWSLHPDDALVSKVWQFSQE